MSIHITRLQNLITQFGSASMRTADVSRRLADLSEDDRLILREAADDLTNGISIPTAREAEIRRVLSQIPPRYSPRQLMNRAASSFRHPQLQSMYLQATASLSPRPSPAEWIASLAEHSIGYSHIRWLCGENFQTDARQIVRARTPIVIASIPAPSARLASASTGEILSSFIQSRRDARRLLTRLSSLFDPSKSAMGRLAAGQIDRGLFSILKGITAENLGLPLVLAAFGEGGAFGRRLDDTARLVHDVQIRINGGSWKDFSDGIIIQPSSSSGLIWHGGVEVKSFTDGFDEAADQVRRRREVFNLTSPFELRIRDGATAYNRHGHIETWSGPSNFQFPPVTGSTIGGIEASPLGVRTLLIAPRDSHSHFDLATLGESIDSSAFEVRLNHTSAEIDFMSAQALQTLRNSDVSIDSVDDAARALASATGARSVIPAE